MNDNHEVEQTISNNDRMIANELKKKWHNALRMCKAQDHEKSGFIARDIFISSLEHHLGSVSCSFLFFFSIFFPLILLPLLLPP